MGVQRGAGTRHGPIYRGVVAFGEHSRFGTCGAWGGALVG
jgi:hypothetical protein